MYFSDCRQNMTSAAFDSKSWRLKSTCLESVRLKAIHIKCWVSNSLYQCNLLGFQWINVLKPFFIFFIPHFLMAYKHCYYQEFILDTFSALTKRSNTSVRTSDLALGTHFSNMSIFRFFISFWYFNKSWKWNWVKVDNIWQLTSRFHMTELL